jgi:hypothetical protein
MAVSQEGRRRRRRPSLAAITLLPVLLAACGYGGSNGNSADCLADPDCPEAAQQAALERDLAAVQRYGADQPDYSTAAFETEQPQVVVIAYFADHLDRHRDALQELVEHPDRLRVRLSERSRGDLERIRDEIRHRLDGTAGWSLGLGADKVLVTLPPGQEPVADELRAKYGDAVEVSIKPPPRPVASD